MSVNPSASAADRRVVDRFFCGVAWEAQKVMPAGRPHGRPPARTRGKGLMGFKPGDRATARHPDDKGWYRVTVKTVAPDGRYLVGREDVSDHRSPASSSRYRVPLKRDWLVDEDELRR
jgi:hypothetical protein